MSSETQKPADVLARALQKEQEGKEASVEQAKREKRFARTGVELLRREQEAKEKAEAEANQLAAVAQAAAAEQAVAASKTPHRTPTEPVPEDSPRSSLKETDPLVGEPSSGGLVAPSASTGSQLPTRDAQQQVSPSNTNAGTTAQGGLVGASPQPATSVGTASKQSTPNMFQTMGKAKWGAIILAVSLVTLGVLIGLTAVAGAVALLTGGAGAPLVAATGMGVLVAGGGVAVGAAMALSTGLAAVGVTSVCAAGLLYFSGKKELRKSNRANVHDKLAQGLQENRHLVMPDETPILGKSTASAVTPQPQPLGNPLWSPTESSEPRTPSGFSGPARYPQRAPDTTGAGTDPSNTAPDVPNPKGRSRT